jgi:hypothetical protein
MRSVMMLKASKVISTCAGRRAAFTGLIVAFEPLTFTFSFPALVTC